MSKLPKRTRTKKRIRWQLPNYVSVGDRLENSDGHVYIVAQVGGNQVQLISLSDGNRWSDKVVYKNYIKNVTVKDLLPNLNSENIKWRLLKKANPLNTK